MASLDLGKQIGPLPLGAWVAVVGGGLGIALWSRSKSGASPTIVDNTSGQAGVGDGTVGGWTSTSPPSTDTGSGTVAPATNEAWGVAAINWLIAQGYPSAVADSAIRKYLAGNDPAPSMQEYVMQQLALQHMGSPPTPLPPSVNEPPSSTPGPVTGTTPPPATTLPTRRYFTVEPGWSVDNTINSLKAHGWQIGWTPFIVQNPTALLNIKWAPRGSPSAWNSFIRRETYSMYPS